MSSHVNTARLTEAIKDLLEDSLSCQVGDGQAPDDREFPYVVLHNLRSRAVASSWRGVVAVRRVTYQLSAAGTSRAEAEDWAHRALEVVVGRGSTGFLNALVVPGHKVLHREEVRDLGGDAEPFGSHQHVVQFWVDVTRTS